MDIRETLFQHANNLQARAAMLENDVQQGTYDHAIKELEAIIAEAAKALAVAARGDMTKRVQRRLAVEAQTESICRHCTEQIRRAPASELWSHVDTSVPHGHHAVPLPVRLYAG